MAVAEFLDYDRVSYCWDGKHWFRVSDSTMPPMGLASRLSCLLSARRQASNRADEDAQLGTLKRPLRVIVAGDRKWADLDLMRRELGRLPAGSVVIHGDANGGADQLAGQAASELGLEVIACPAKSGRPAKSAVLVRNKAMLADHKPDLVIAFSADLDQTTSAKHLVTIARKAGVAIRVIAGQRPHSRGNLRCRWAFFEKALSLSSMIPPQILTLGSIETKCVSARLVAYPRTGYRTCKIVRVDW